MLEPNEERRHSAAQVLGDDLLITDNEDLFFAQDLNVVSICSPSLLHARHIHRVFRSKVEYVWIEKPVTVELSEYTKLLDEWGRHPSPPKNAVNYLRRGLPQFKILKDLCTQPGLISLDFVYSRGLEINGVHMLDILGYVLDLTRPPKLDWVQQGNGGVGIAGNPSFGFRAGSIGVSFRGLDLPYHCIECRASLEGGRVSVLGGGSSIIREPRVENADYPGFFHLGNPFELLPSKHAHDALLDGTYRSLASLIDDGEPSSTLYTAYFAQALMEQVRGALE
jgi:predicted dehydrogenase